MERREVLRRTIAGGMTMVITHLLPETPADAAELAKKKPKVQFQEGTLTGGGVDGWKALIAVTGSTVRGTCWDPATVKDGHYDGWRVRGRARNGTLKMDFFALGDHGFSKRIGKCNGKARGRKFRAAFSLFNIAGVQGGKSGQMDVAEVKLSPATQRDNAGDYVVEVFDTSEGLEATEPAGSFRASVDANGKFRISDGTSNSPKLAGKLPKETVGRWGMTEESTIYTVTQADELVIAESPVDYSEVNKGQPIGDPQGTQGSSGGNCFVNFCANCLCAAQNRSIPPAAPTDLRIMRLESPLRVGLVWTDNSNNEDGFKVERKVGTGAFQEIIRVAQAEFIDQNVMGGNLYTYRVRAYNEGADGQQDSSYTNEQSITL